MNLVKKACFHESGFLQILKAKLIPEDDVEEEDDNDSPSSIEGKKRRNLSIPERLNAHNLAIRSGVSLFNENSE